MKIHLRCLTLALLGFSLSCMVGSDDMRSKGLLGTIWERQAEREDLVPKTQPGEGKGLFDAIAEDDLGELLTALEQGASVHVYDGEGRSPLRAAIDKGNTELTAILMQWRAEPTIEDFCAAIEGDCTGCALELMRFRMDYNDSCGDGQTPLIKAVRWGDPDLVQALVDRGARSSLTDRAGKTPAEYAAEAENLGSFPDTFYNYERIAELLAEAKR